MQIFPRCTLNRRARCHGFIGLGNGFVFERRVLCILSGLLGRLVGRFGGRRGLVNHRGGSGDGLLGRLGNGFRSSRADNFAGGSTAGAYLRGSFDGILFDDGSVMNIYLNYTK